MYTTIKELTWGAFTCLDEFLIHQKFAIGYAIPAITEKTNKGSLYKYGLGIFQYLTSG